MGFYSAEQPLQTFETASPGTPSSSMTQSLYSASFSIKNANQFLTFAVWTGAPVGTIKVMGSLDNVNFLTPMDSITTGGEAGSRTFDIFGTSMLWARIEYTFTSGSGNLTCFSTIKVPN